MVDVGQTVTDRGSVGSEQSVTLSGALQIVKAGTETVQVSHERGGVSGCRTAEVL